MRVVIADDSLITREGVQALITSQPEFEVVGVAGSLHQLLAEVERARPDVVVTDIRMPPTSTDEGIQAARQLREAAPEVGVVVLSQFAEPQYALRLLEHGSAGRAYLLKEHLSRPHDLFEAIRRVADGGSAIDPAVVEVLVQARSREERSPLGRLTARELDVLSEMAQGRSNQGIADALHLSLAAIEKHITSIFSKLGLSDEREAHRRVRAVLVYLSEQSTSGG